MIKLSLSNNTKFAIIEKNTGEYMNNNYIQILDSLILSPNAVEDFYNKYNNDRDFKSWLDKFIPEIDKCEKQQQNTPWHKYNVLRHILHSVEEMNKCTYDLPDNDKRMLAYVMLFHDIGKPDKHIVRIKNGKQQDSFFNHNIRSCEIAKDILPKLNFNEQECNIMLKLIHKHDIFMFIKEFKSDNPYWRTLTDEVILEEVTDLSSVGDGYKLMQYLLKIGRCDNLSQNEKMTGESLKMLDKFESMLANLINKTKEDKLP